MIELSSLLLDFPSAAWGANATLAAELQAEAVLFKSDIDRAVRNSVVRDDATGAIVYVPAAVTQSLPTALPVLPMTGRLVRLRTDVRSSSNRGAISIPRPSWTI